MKIYLNRRPVHGPWGGGNLWVKAFYECAPQFGVELTSDPLSADVLIVIGMDRGDTGVSLDDAYNIATSFRDHNKHVTLVTRINENDARKNTTHVDSMMLYATLLSNGVVFVSNWLKSYYTRHPYARVDDVFARFTRAPVIINGVDRKIFYPRPNCKIFDRTVLRIVAHHWSNNALKGFDYYEFLDKFADQHDWCRFHYIGRDRGTFYGKNTTVTPACSGPALGNVLGEPSTSHQIYVSASRFDPGPNHCLEALASGLEIYAHCDGGGAVEFADINHTFSSEDELVAIMERAAQGMHLPNTYEPPTWEQCIEQYVNYIKQLHAQ